MHIKMIPAVKKSNISSEKKKKLFKVNRNKIAFTEAKSFPSSI